MVFIDGDVLPYQIGFATQKKVYLLETQGRISGPFLSTKSKRLVNKFLERTPDLIVSEFFFVEDPIQVIQTLKAHLRQIVQGSGCDTFRVVLSGDTNFRERIATILPYKGNREGSEKPYHFNLIREWLLDKPYTIVSEDEEADDVISKAMIQGHIGASPDKDLDNTPGTHYNFRKGITYEVSEEDAMKNFYKQMMTGDKADNIPGIRGFGPVRTDSLFENCVYPEDYESLIFKEYEKVYEKPWEAIEEVGRLLWMRRYDGEMWESCL